MKFKARSFAVAVMVLSAWSVPALARPRSAAPSPELAVWTSPIRTTVSALWLLWPSMVDVTLGLDFPIQEQHFQLELSVLSTAGNGFPGWVSPAGTGGSIAVSWKWALNRNEPLQGFFVSPKLLFGYATTPFATVDEDVVRVLSSQRPSPDQHVFDVQVGADVGYQWTFFGHFYLALVLGGTVGASDAPRHGDLRDNAFAGPQLRTISDKRGWFFSAMPNFNFLRVGAAF